MTNNSLWLAQTDDQFGFNNGAATFVNNGTFRKTAFNGITYFRGILVLNNGTMDAESGSINFQAGGVLSGTYNVAAGANIKFANGNFTLGAQPAITGTGSVNFSGGGMSVLTNLPTNLQLTGGTLTLAATFQKKRCDYEPDARWVHLVGQLHGDRNDELLRRKRQWLVDHRVQRDAESSIRHA